MVAGLPANPILRTARSRIRSSVIRYVAKFAATQDEDKLRRLLSTSVAIYAAVCLIVLLLTGLGFFFLQSLFKIAPGILRSARVLFVLAATGAALTFPLSIFAAVLEGLPKFSWLHLSQIGVTLLRGLLIVISITQGGGLVAVGSITVGMNLLGYLVFVWMAFRAFPLRLGTRYVNCTRLFGQNSVGQPSARCLGQGWALLAPTEPAGVTPWKALARVVQSK